MMELNGWAIAFLVLYAISLINGLYNISKGNEWYTHAPITCGKHGFFKIIFTYTGIGMFFGALGAYQ